MVEIGVSGYPKDISQPAHIHFGSCKNLGPIKYPLTSVVNGQSETVLGGTLAQLRAELPLAINIHKSEAKPGVYVSCGDIKL